MGSKVGIRLSVLFVLALVLERGGALPTEPNATSGGQQLAQGGPIDTDNQGGVQHKPDLMTAPAAATATQSGKDSALIRRGADRSIKTTPAKAAVTSDRARPDKK